MGSPGTWKVAQARRCTGRRVALRNTEWEVSCLRQVVPLRVPQPLQMRVSILVVQEADAPIRGVLRVHAHVPQTTGTDKHGDGLHVQRAEGTGFTIGIGAELALSDVAHPESGQHPVPQGFRTED